MDSFFDVHDQSEQAFAKYFVPVVKFFGGVWFELTDDLRFLNIS